MKENVNILVTLNENYIPYLNVMLTSLLYSNRDCYFCVYLLHSSVREEAVEQTRYLLGNNGELILINAENVGLDNAPTTSRYPTEIYYRIFAARYLPNTLDRILYLDPDLIVNGSVLSLYKMDMGNNYFAAASHVKEILRKVNGVRLDMGDDSPYINSGVMLMNLELLRKEQKLEDVFQFIEKRKNLLVLPDQDIISGLYGSRIHSLDPFVYNMTERLYQKKALLGKGIDLDWIRKNSIIIHYCGRNKPWKETYFGELDIFYREAANRLALRKKINNY